MIETCYLEEASDEEAFLMRVGNHAVQIAGEKPECCPALRELKTALAQSDLRRFVS